MNALWAVAEAGPGVWDGEYETARMWREFVLAVYTSDALFDPDELRQWLQTVGWPGPDAASLVDRMSRDTTLLAEYEDRRQTA